MEKVSEPDTNSCLTAKKLKITGIRERIVVSEFGNFTINFNLMRVVPISWGKNIVASYKNLLS